MSDIDCTVKFILINQYWRCNYDRTCPEWLSINPNRIATPQQSAQNTEQVNDLSMEKKPHNYSEYHDMSA